MTTLPQTSPGQSGRRAEHPDQKAHAQFAAQLMAEKERSEMLHRLAIAATWVVLFAILGAALSLMNVEFSYILEHFGFVFLGLGVTITVSLVSIAVASLLALVGALMRLSPRSVLQGVAGFYVSLFRGTPLLIQIYIIYLGLPQVGQQLKLLGYPRLGDMLILDAIQSGILALSLNYGAYMTEIFRAGIQSVSHGQWQAAFALGLSRMQTLRLVVLPQAFRVILPAVGNQFIAMQKDSSLVSIMGVWEITYRANRFARKDSRFMEMFLLAAAIYWILTIISEWLQSRLEQRMAKEQH